MKLEFTTTTTTKMCFRSLLRLLPLSLLFQLLGHVIILVLNVVGRKYPTNDVMSPETVC